MRLLTFIVVALHFERYKNLRLVNALRFATCNLANFDAIFNSTNIVINELLGIRKMLEPDRIEFYGIEILL